MVVSHWSVSSAATVPLLVRAVEGMQEDSGSGPSASLRDAMLWMARGEAGSAFQAPAYWAPFVLLGDNQLGHPDKLAAGRSQ